MKLKFLQAHHGDSIIISFADKENNTRNILIDGGVTRTYGSKNLPGPLYKEINKIKGANQNIDLLIITHIDDDHIAGIIKMFEDQDFDASIVKEIWFNSGNRISKHFNTEYNEKREIDLFSYEGCETSYKQGNSLEKIIENLNWEENMIIKGFSKNFYGLNILVLSPTLEILNKLNDKWEYEIIQLETAGKNDDYNLSIEELLENDSKNNSTSLSNQSSIAFILEENGKKVLLTGDAHSNILYDSLLDYANSNSCDLTFNLVKLPHHGSSNNYLPNLANLITCEKYVISTNGDMHCNPDKLTLARIINSKNEAPTFYFNYPISKRVFNMNEKQYNFNIKELSENEGIEI